MRISGAQMEDCRAVTPTDVLDALPIMVWQVDCHGRRTFLNRAWCAFTGRSPEEALAGSWEDIIHPDDQGCLQLFQKSFAVRHPFAFEYRARRADGQYRWMMDVGEPLHTPDGEFAGYVGFCHNVHRRKELAQAGQQFERQFRELLENINLIAVCLDVDGRVAFANECLLDMTGWTLDTILGESWFDRFVPSSNTWIRRIFAANMQSGTIPRYFQNDILTRSGEHRFISWNNTILRDAAGAVTGVACIGEDITARKLAEDELCASQEQLKELVAELSFAEERERRRIATELHDGVAQNLVFAKFKANELLQASSDCESQQTARSLRETLEQTIDEIRSLTFQLSPPLLYEVGFEAALEWLGEQFQDKHGFRVNLEIDDNPKPLGEDVSVTLFQMVRELLVNATKHAEASRITIRLTATKNRLRITVADNGRGIDLSGSADKAAMPDGFGLFNIRQRMQYINGKMAMESSPGAGTTITLYAPLNRS